MAHHLDERIDLRARFFRRDGRFLVETQGADGAPAEFAVFAPATDETGVEGLVQRITDAVGRAAAIRLRAGVSTAGAEPRPARPSQAAPHQASPADLLDRARGALR